MLERFQQAYESTVNVGAELSNQVMDHIKGNWQTVTNNDAPTKDRILAGTLLVGEGLAVGAGAYALGRIGFNRATANMTYPAKRISVEAFSGVRTAGFEASSRAPSFHYKAFYDDMNAAVGTSVRSSDKAAGKAWGSLANVAWFHEKHPPMLHSWRRSGEIIAQMKGEGDMLHWYLSSQYGQVPRWMQRAMASKGWTPKIID